MIIHLKEDGEASDGTWHAFVSSQPDTSRSLIVQRGSHISFEIVYDNASRTVSFMYDNDIDDHVPALSISILSTTPTPTGQFNTSLNVSVEGPFGPPTGTLENWTLVSTDMEGDYDGNGQLSLHDMSFIHNAATTRDAFFDLNHDGVVNGQDATSWAISVFGTYYGDADLDGQFGSSDLINVFQAGEYEDDVVGNSTWSTGDWNADGEFSTSDLVVAFQDGGYEQGPRVVASVPEPSGLWSLLIGVLAFVKRQRRWNGILPLPNKPRVLCSPTREF